MEPEKTTLERAEDLILLLVPDWRPTPQQVLWSIRIVFTFVIVLGILTLVGRPFAITLWDWIKLLIVPAVIAAGGLWFNTQQQDHQLKIQEQRSQDEALQAYLDQMSQLILRRDRPNLLEAEEGDPVYTLAQARTSTVMSRLDAKHNASVIRFLSNSRLAISLLRNVVLEEADLEKTNLSGADLKEATLIKANLRGADLSRADLSGADLSRATLIKANLRGADLSGSNLTEVNLKGAFMDDSIPAPAFMDSALLPDKWNKWNRLTMKGRAVNLENAILRGAHLEGAILFNARLENADLSGASLSGANLSGANLREASGCTEEQLTAARLLQGATMPNGQKYEDWLKSKGREEDGESGGSS